MTHHLILIDLYPYKLKLTQAAFKQKQTEELERQQQIQREKEEEERKEMVRRKKEQEEIQRQNEIKKEQEIQRRRELQMMAEIERERRRQHMILVRSLEMFKRQEERERKREELAAEKRIQQEKRMQKKRIEMELLKELKKPVDDMMLKDLKPLPTLNRIPGLKLPSSAFSNILMVYEFLNNFGETIGFDMDSLPTLNTLQLALMNLDESSEDELLSVMHHLLVCAIDDPGLPVNMTTLMGQKLKDAAVTNINLSEVLRIYFSSFSNQRISCATGFEGKIVKIFSEGKNFLSLSPNLKAEIVAYLCNELLCNQSIVKKIDENIETVANLRRDKWIIDCDLRKFRNIKSKREMIKKAEDDAREALAAAAAAQAAAADAAAAAAALQKQKDLESSEDQQKESDDQTTATDGDNKTDPKDDETKPKVDVAKVEVTTLTPPKPIVIITPIKSAPAADLSTMDDGDSGGSGDENDDGHGLPPLLLPLNNSSLDDEEPEMTNEEIDKKIEKLSRQCTLMTNKLNKAVHGLRVPSLGQDRYRRRYWVLPAAGGVFVEGMESGEPDEMENNNHHDEDDTKINEDSEEDDDDDEKDDDDESDSSDDKKMDVDNDDGVKKEDNDDHETDPIENSSDAHQYKKEDTQSEQNVDDDDVKDNKADVKHVSNGIEDESDQIKTDGGEKMITDDYNKTTEENTQSDNKKSESGSGENDSENKSSSDNKTWISPLVASVLSGSGVLNGSTPANDNSVTGDNNNSSTSDSIPVKSSQQQQQWFSLLPRVPCCQISNNSTENIPSEDADEKKPNADIPLMNGSLLSNGISENALMQAIMNPQLMSSLFQQKAAADNKSSTTESVVVKQPDVKSIKQEASGSSGQNVSGSINVSAIISALDELEVCPALQKRLQQQKEEQWDDPQKISPEYQFGWWRLTDPSQVRILNEALHERGVRERLLHKHLMKYFNYVSTKCKSSVVEFDVTDDDRRIFEECPFGAPTPSQEDFDPDVAVRIDLTVLEQIELLEEKIANSSMQIRGWRPMVKLSQDPNVKFKHATSSEMIEKKEGPDGIEFGFKEGFRMEDLETDTILNPVTVGKHRLLSTEAVIERRYLKPPLGFKSNTIILPSNVSATDELAENAADENAPSGLLRWRDAVRECTTSFQLALLLHFLESCIAWDKSIMRAVSVSGVMHDMLLILFIV